MINTILGKKKYMGQAFVETTRVPVTYVEAGPCVVTQIKKEKQMDIGQFKSGLEKKRSKM